MKKSLMIVVGVIVVLLVAFGVNTMLTGKIISENETKYVYELKEKVVMVSGQRYVIEPVSIGEDSLILDLDGIITDDLFVGDTAVMGNVKMEVLEIRRTSGNRFIKLQLSNA